MHMPPPHRRIRNRRRVLPRGLLPVLALAVAGVASAAYTRRKSAEAEAENPPTGRFVHVDGMRLHYVERGSGQPLVLIHGNTMMGLDFLLSDLVRMAQPHYRVIVIDRPGYGHSSPPRDARGWTPERQAQVIHQALRRIGVDEALVVGHSWGAMVAAALALNHPQMVRGLVLESGYYFPRPRFDILMRAPNVAPVLGGMLRHSVSPVVHRMAWPLMARMLFAPAPVPRHFWRFPAWMAFRPEQLRAQAAEMAGILAAAERLAPRYADLEVPLVILAGRDDAFVRTADHSARLAALLPQAEFRQFAGVGHMMHHLIPQEILAAVATVNRER
ncbi:alpha/beta fold hydrolase [Plastorhodobacter daqingensis]|uniref:Alpha/beta fold hydrolase n=1 Tax=Plastorhodobacter daqingensis TaxID=1387281 RepID=A0ABW2UG81_9RHOB